MKSSMYNNYVSVRDDKYELIFNSATGAIHYLNPITAERLRNNTISDDMPYYDELCKNGYLVDDSIDEFGVIQYRKNREYFSAEKRGVCYTVCPTLKCNLKCVYCYEGLSSSNILMNETTQDNVVCFMKKHIASIKSVNKVTIRWFGGEPLLCDDVIRRISREIQDYCHNNKLKYSSGMITNGVMLDKVINYLDDFGITDGIQITLDGDMDDYCIMKGASKESYEKVISAILELCKRNVILSVRFNVCKENVSSIIPSVKDLCEMGFKGTIYLARIFDENTNENRSFTVIEEDEYRYLKREFNTLIGKYPTVKRRVVNDTVPRLQNCGVIAPENVVIGPEGEFYRCEHHVGRKEMIVGDARVGFYRNDIERKYYFIDPPAKCKNCSVYPVCFGGCPNDYLNGIEFDCQGKMEDVYDSVFYLANKH